MARTSRAYGRDENGERDSVSSSGKQKEERKTKQKLEGVEYVKEKPIRHWRKIARNRGEWQATVYVRQFSIILYTS